MDLRSSLTTPAAVDRGAAVLNYQPFILTDELQTGVAYSWVSGDDPRVAPPLVFRRHQFTAEWPRITDANARLRAMYDCLLDEVARRVPGGTLLDVACNNGYFPVGAERRGMRGTGMDLNDHSKSIEFLNRTFGTKAKFLHRAYDPKSHTLPVSGQYDVTVMSAIMCHIPDPLHYLAAVAKATRRVLLFWGQMVDTQALLVSYHPPHAGLARRELVDFPNCFNDNTRLSRGLFELSARMLGFSEFVEITPNGWLDGLHHDLNQPLEDELKGGSRHVAIMAIR